MRDAPRIPNATAAYRLTGARPGLHVATAAPSPHAERPVRESEHLFIVKASAGAGGCSGKWSERNRGGFCYELNTLFALLLREIGFKVSFISGEIRARDGHFGALRPSGAAGGIWRDQAAGRRRFRRFLPDAAEDHRRRAATAGQRHLPPGTGRRVLPAGAPQRRPTFACQNPVSLTVQPRELHGSTRLPTSASPSHFTQRTV